MKSIPRELQQDRYWKGTLHIFTNNPKLQRYAASYIDFEECTINAEGLKRIARPWSDSERFMLNLALHLFNERYKVNLSDMDYLDTNNRQIALKAIQMRFAG
ncbi:hypothetical protein KQJ23_00390 [Paenibacillus sp. MSJ-6]|uniref:Uncharacterized protein n=2 Tax=Paenibacillus brevis TaxID=2841508 RepID=A0ABS6FM11_9BACL|nr:hypothetical protein [Paenibacillus brevis]